MAVMKGKDKDYRYMATSYLLNELNKEGFKLDGDLELRVSSIVLQQLGVGKASHVVGDCSECCSGTPTPSETSKVENAPAEMLRDLEQQMEKRADDGCTLWIKLYSKYEYEIHYHPGRTNVVIDALRRKKRVKPRRVRAMAMTIQYGVRGMILAAQSEAHASRFRWMTYLAVLADTAESDSDAIRFEYCLASSNGWTK
ncbi:putative reverse transcriptase domain-containing protein [Tanacetum coccineum]